LFVKGKMVTAAGVSAGIDMELVALARTEEIARMVPLIIEYGPQPPFDSGSRGQGDGVGSDKL
jgi:hypothetical protein